MKSAKLITGLFVVLALISCGTKTLERAPVEISGDRLFQEAEAKFDARLYDQALELYSRYLEGHPEGVFAPAALFKKGAVYSAIDEYEKARQCYSRIVEKYPDGIYTPDAMVEILVSYYKEERFREVVKHGDDLPDGLKPDDYRVRKYNVLGDAFMKLEAFVDAADSYAKAYMASGEVERISLGTKLSRAAAMLSGDEVTRMLDRTVEEDIRGYLLYRLYRSYAENGKTEEAIRGLTDFLASYSEHPVAGEAELLKKELVAAEFTPGVIGCLLPISGKYEAYGLKAQMGVDLAYHVFSSSRGETDLKIIYRDTESDPEATRQAVKELAEAGVAAIVGPVGTVEAAAAEAQMMGVPIITLTGKADIPATGDYVFRNFITKKMQVSSVVTYAFEVLGINNFAVLYPDEKYGRTFLNLFWDEVMKFGGDIVGAESYGAKDTDFSEPIKKLVGRHYKIPKALRAARGEGTGSGAENQVRASAEPAVEADFDAIFIPDASSKVGLILPQLAFHDLGDLYFLGTNLWHSDTLLDMAARDAGGAIIPDAFFSGSSDRTVKKFVGDFQRFFMEKPGFIEAIAYDSAMILFETLNREGVASLSDVRDRLLDLNDFKGVTGLTSFDETGDAIKDLYLLNVKGTKFRELEK